jgi:hypothetical protein
MDWLQPHIPIRTKEEYEQAKKAASRASSAASYARKTGKREKADEETGTYQLLQMKLMEYTKNNATSIADVYQSEAERAKAASARAHNEMHRANCRMIDNSVDAVRAFSGAGIVPQAPIPSLLGGASVKMMPQASVPSLLGGAFAEMVPRPSTSALAFPPVAPQIDPLYLQFLQLKDNPQFLQLMHEMQAQTP